MTGGSANADIYAMQIIIDPLIMRAIEVLGTGPNLEAQLTGILNALLTDRLEDINARILECQAEDLKNENEEEEEDKSVEVTTRSIAVQQQLMAIRQLLTTYTVSPAGKHEKDQENSTIALNLAQFAAIQALGDKKARILDFDLGSMLLDLGNIKLAQLNSRIAKELAEKGEQPVSPAKPNPDLLQQKEFLAFLGDLEKGVEIMAARSGRIYHIQGGIKMLVDTCASVLQIPASEVQGAVDKLLQKEQSVVDALSYEVLYDDFARNVKDFEKIASQISLEKKYATQLGKTQINKLIKKKTRKKVAPKIRVEEPERQARPEPPLSLAISDITILDNLTAEPIEIRDLIAKMGITEMSDARWLQLQLRDLEKRQKVNGKVSSGKKLYWKT